jgi:hypothetical protein
MPAFRSILPAMSSDMASSFAIILTVHGEVPSGGFLPSAFRMSGATFLKAVAPRLAGVGSVRETLNPVRDEAFPPLPDRVRVNQESLADVAHALSAQENYLGTFDKEDRQCPAPNPGKQAYQLKGVEVGTFGCA